MKLFDAIDLLRTSEFPQSTPATWADLGCGAGLFTQALATLLSPQSRIIAIDKKNSLKQALPANEVQINFQQADFVKDHLPLPALNGLLMANALHYVRDKKTFVQKMQAHLQTDAMWIVVEYDTTKANLWVPYPVAFEKLQQLFLDAGYKTIRKVGERPSIYNSGKMYCAAITA